MGGTQLEEGKSKAERESEIEIKFRIFVY